MMTPIKKLSLMLVLLLASMMNAFAAPGNSWGVGDGVWTVRARDWLAGGGERRDDARQRRMDRPNGRRYDEGPYTPGGNGAPEDARRSRMTPEERRTLRRQIDEAGRDIYAPRR
jgi:hypothetical protein